MHTNTPLHRRRGITLIEVLMSLFVITVGIIGVLALIYLGHFHANRGATADRAAAAGQNSIRSFKLLGMDNPASWRSSAGAIVSVDPAGSDDAMKPMQLGFAKRYVLDPRGVARGLTGTFPANGVVAASGGIPRITLYDGRVISNASNGMLIPQADHVFCLHDDLAFTVVENDPTAVPMQTMENTSEKRFAARDFSWLATLVREQPGEQYTLSVAVVQGRNKTTGAELALEEAQFDCTFLGAGTSGGDVTLTSVAATEPVLKALRPGQWLLLALTERARWYRVISAGEMYGGGTPPLSRDVTLVGRDWDTGGAYATPKAVILMNTIGVYERTVRLKTDSLWQP